MKIKDRVKPKVPTVAPGVYMAVCIGVIDLGEQYSEIYKSYSNKMKFVWALPSETVEIDGKKEERQLSREFSIATKQTSKLRTFLSSWNGKSYTDDEYLDLDLFEQIGKSCMLNGTSIESAFLMNDGKNTISVEVKDSRGFTATSTTEIIVLPYSSPTIANMPGETSLSCYRANKDGTPNDSGINVYVKVARAYSKIVVDSVQKNFCDMEWRCKNRFDVWSDQEWYPMIARDENTRDWFSAILIDNIEEQPVVFETSQSYTVQIRVKDDIGDFSAIDLDVFREAVDLHLGGNCLGIGRYADQSMPFSVKIDERWTVFFGETDIKDIFLNISHPVGAYLHTDNSANPGETIGGTWELINSDTEYIWKRTA